MANQSVGPYQIAELDIHLVNEIFRQIEEQVNQLRGLGLSVNITIGAHSHQTATTGGKLDHGAALTGLADNDHPQYLLASTLVTDQTLDDDQAGRISDQVMVGTGLTLTEQADGSGDAVQLALADTVVTPGTYGDASNVSQITVDQQGRLTSAGSVAIIVTATDASDIATIDAVGSAEHITDQVMVGEDLTLSEPGESAGDSIFLDVATIQTLNDSQGSIAQGFEQLIDGLSDFSIAVDSTSRLHIQGLNRFRYFNTGSRVYNSGSQTITNNTFVAINFDTEEFDTDSLHDTVTNNNRITVNIAGKYAITGSVRWAISGTGERVNSVRKNGVATDLLVASARGNGSSRDRIMCTGLLSLAVSDYIELYVLQDSGGNLDVEASGQETSFGAIYVGE